GPADTVICPFSLHDALPISRSLPITHSRTSSYPSRYPGHDDVLALLDTQLQKSGHVRSERPTVDQALHREALAREFADRQDRSEDRKSTRLNSSHVKISYAV